MESGGIDGFTPVRLAVVVECLFWESGCLETQPKDGGKLHLRLNTTVKPIENKYREGKLKSTLKRECKRT